MKKIDKKIFTFSNDDWNISIKLEIDYKDNTYSILPWDNKYKNYFKFTEQRLPKSVTRDIALLILEANSFAELDLSLNRIANDT